MAVNIGPRIGIDGEKEYRKSINDIIQQQKTLKAEMKATASEWDKSTSAEKKAADQKKALTEQVKLQEKRVEELNKMLDASRQKYGENDSATLKWREAVANATAELNRMKQELDDIPNGLQLFGEKMNEAGGKLTDISGKMQGFGGAVTKYVSGPIAAVGGVSLAAFNEVDNGLDTIIKKTGASGETLAGFKKSMEDVATSVPTSFDKAGAAVGEVNTRFGLMDEELTRVSAAFIKFADLNGTDVSNSIDKVQSAMAAFNLDGAEAETVLDMLNKAGQDTGVSVDGLADSLQANATALKDMGFGINESIGLLANLDKNGVDTSAVMTGLRTALKNATADGKPMSEALAELDSKMRSAKTDTEAMQYATELFGSKAGPQLAAAIQEGRLSLDQMSNSVTDFGGNVETTFNATLDPPDKLKTTLNELKIVGADLGGTLLEMAVPALEKLSDVVKSAKEYWDGLDDSTKENITKAGLLVAAIGPVITILGTVIGTVGKVISVGGTVVSTVGSIVSVLGGPLTIAIGAAIAAGVLLWQNWDTVKEYAGKLYDTVKEKFDAIKTKIEKVVEDIKAAFKFEWSLPELKLPHIVVGSYITVPVLGTIPDPTTLRIEWYKKAMQGGMILNQPTIFGAQNGHLLGAGEAGPEVVVGAGSLFDMIRQAVGSTTNNYGGNNVYVYGAPGQDVSELAREVADLIDADVQSRRAVWA